MSYTDWTGAVEATIPERKQLKILEFGLGAGTKYLVDNFKYVYSYELIDERDHSLKEWAEISKNDYKYYTNWDVEVVNWSDINFKDYNPNLVSGLTDRIDMLFAEHNFEAVLVDGGYHVRGDIANYILNKFTPKYVLIHDTNFNYVVDGYERIQKPELFEIYNHTDGEGTHVYINKQWKQ
jgi:hypothetical protein